MGKIIKITEQELINTIKSIMNEQLINPNANIKDVSKGLGKYYSDIATAPAKIGQKVGNVINNRWKKMGGATRGNKNVTPAPDPSTNSMVGNNPESVAPVRTSTTKGNNFVEKRPENTNNFPFDQKFPYQPDVSKATPPYPDPNDLLKKQVKGDYQQKTPQYKVVNNFPFPQYSKNDEYIKPLQKALGIKEDGYFGPRTSKAVAALGYNVTGGLTQEIFNDVMKKQRKDYSSVMNKTEKPELRSVSPLGGMKEPTLATRTPQLSPLTTKKK